METVFLRLVLSTFLCIAVVKVKAQSNSTTSGFRGETISNKSNSLPDITALCPYNRFCLSSPVKVIGSADLESCCEKCSCNIDCFVIGNCCPDVPFAGVSRPKYTCVKLSSLTEEITHKKVYNDNDLWYHVITVCSDGLKEVQYPRCGMPSKIQDLIPVSDPVNGRVYRNSQCAKCNGVQTYVTWDLRVDCRDIYSISFQTFEEKNRYIFENCVSLPQPPDIYTGELSRCYPDTNIIKQCNVTGRWDNHEEELEINCRKQELYLNTIYTKPYRFVYQMYANVYCYLCNHAAALAEVQDCALPKGSVVGKGSPFVSYVGLIELSTELFPVKDTNCLSMEVWDPFKNFCRRLTCPGGTFPYYGSCRDINRLSTGYAIRLYFEVSSVSAKTIPTNSEILVVLEAQVLSHIGFDCEKCESSLLRQMNSTNIVLSVNLFSTAKCSTTKLLQTLQETAVGKSITCRFRYQGRIHIIEMKLALNYEQNDDILLYMKPWQHCPPINLLDSTILLYCARIDIAREEVSTLGLLNMSANYSRGSDADADVVPVCLDAYFLASEALSGKASNHQHDNECKVTCMLVVLMFINVSVKSLIVGPS